MGYEHTVEARGDNGLSYTFGVLVPHRFIGKYNSFYCNMYQGVVQRLSNLNYYVILEVILPDDDENFVLPNMLASERVDGIIMLGQMKPHYIDFLIQRKMPMMFLDCYDKHSDIDSIIRTVYGIYTITCILVDNGHDNIGYVGRINGTSSANTRSLCGIF